jgi:hypothetical protein
MLPLSQKETLMTRTNVENMKKRREALKQRIASVGAMRPGTLTVQYRDPLTKRNPFHQLSYTHKSKSRSEYIRPEHVKAIHKQVAEYKRFKKLVEELIDISIQISKLNMQQNRE